MPLETILRELYAREINVSISSFWDAGYTVRLGDDMNGYRAEREFKSEEFDQIGDWLLAHADDPPQPGTVPVNHVMPGFNSPHPATVIRDKPKNYTGPYRYWGLRGSAESGTEEWTSEIVAASRADLTHVERPMAQEWWDGRQWVGMD